ncbi:hypothetical protein [Streptomyces sp. NPDC001020]
MIVAERIDRSASGDRAADAAPGRSRTAAFIMPAVTGAAPAFRSFAYDTARRWGLPDSVCDVVALMASELVHDLARFSAGLDTSLILTADETAVIVQVRESGRPRPVFRAPSAHGVRRARREEAPTAPRRPVGGVRREARVLLPEPEHM